MIILTTILSASHKFQSTFSSFIPPLIRIFIGCIQEIKIPVVDADGDTVKFRWLIEDECGISCEKPPNVELDG